jgi:hypothetical protein
MTAVLPLYPLAGSPYEFSRTTDHIDRAILSTDAYLAQRGRQRGKIPHERLHGHGLGRARGRYAALQKRLTEPENIFAARCHIRDRRPVYRMGLPHRLD